MKCLTKVKIFALTLRKWKLETVKYADIHGNRATGRKYAVDEKRIHEWRRNKNKIVSLMSIDLRKRLDGAQAKPLNKNLKRRIMNWIIFKRLIGLRVLGKLVMKKTLLTYKEIAPSEG